MKNTRSTQGTLTTVDEDGTIVAAGAVAPGLAMSLVFAIALAVLLAIIVATALTGPAGAAPLGDLADAGRSIDRTPARDVSYVVIDRVNRVVATDAPAKTMAIVVVASLFFGMTTMAGMIWRSLTRSIARTSSRAPRSTTATR